ncbi:MAG: helix-turn-helix domain-containing protein [Hyphomicrobiaceae bacterium]
MSRVGTQQSQLHASTFEPISYRIKDAERLTGISKSMIYLLAARGDITLSRVGRRTLVPRSELERLIEAGRTKA